MFRSTRKMQNLISDRLAKVSGRSEHSYDPQSAKTLFLMKIALVWKFWDPIFGVGSPTSKKFTDHTRHSIDLIFSLNGSSNYLVYGKNNENNQESSRKSPDQKQDFSLQIFRFCVCTYLQTEHCPFFFAKKGAVIIKCEDL